MKFGIKQKILLVLVGVLALTTVLHVILASYYTDKQNEDAAFANLRRDLLTWQSDMQGNTQRLRREASAAVSDSATMDQLAELMTLEFLVDDPTRTSVQSDVARTLAYRKTVSLNRLQLALFTGGFYRIAVYTRGTLSHSVSATEAGMTRKRPDGRSVWVAASANEKGVLPFQSWPAWEEKPMPPIDSVALAPPKRPSVSVVFPDAEQTSVEIAVPVEGFVEDVMTDAKPNPTVRWFSNLAISGAEEKAAAGSARGAGGQSRHALALVVFDKRIDRTWLEDRAAKVGRSTALFSPDGRHRQVLSSLPLFPADLLRQVQGDRSADEIRRTVTAGEKSFYVALQPWNFEGQPQLILGLATPRDSTLHNIHQTVAAILLVSGITLLLSVSVGLVWVRRFMDPIVHLTSAVQEIASRNRLGNADHRTENRSLESLRPIEVTAPDEVGALTQAFNSMLTELHQSFETLEQRVQVRTEELRQQARYLRTLIDMLPMWAWFKDSESRFLAVNQAVADGFGMAADEVVGKSDFDVSPRELAETYRADDAEVMSSRRQKTVQEPQGSPGERIWLETFKAPVIDEDGTVLGTVGVARDISEHKITEAAREAALVEAQRLARLRSQFLAQMSHELRTPLNGILGYAQLLLRDKTLDARQIAGLTVIRKSGDHLLALINDILDLARVEAGRAELYRKDVSLRGMVQALAEMIGVRAAQKGLEFRCELAPNLPDAIYADEKRLCQILLNLLDNAIKFTDHGKVLLRVELVRPGRLRFLVQDTGIGIAPNQLGAVFQPFEQVGDERRRTQGSGLGLAISHEFVRLMGGSIQVSSELGAGTSFSFELETMAAGAGSEPVQPGGLVTGYRGPRRKILVVDDVQENRDVIVKMLDQIGFEVVEAADGRESLAMAQSQQPDLILMDIIMPEMSGLEAIGNMRRIPALRRTPIIVLSASASSSEEKKSIAAGADAFLPKPVDFNLLLLKIATLLQLEVTHDAPAQGASA
jgi:PAS domain S-box-containing protein